VVPSVTDPEATLKSWMKAVEPFGLKELIQPPYILVDSIEKNKK